MALDIESNAERMVGRNKCDEAQMGQRTHTVPIYIFCYYFPLFSYRAISQQAAAIFDSLTSVQDQ